MAGYGLSPVGAERQRRQGAQDASPLVWDWQAWNGRKVTTTSGTVRQAGPGKARRGSEKAWRGMAGEARLGLVRLGVDRIGIAGMAREARTVEACIGMAGPAGHGLPR